MMEAPRVILAGCWIALMLIYLLGDVIRIFAGQFTPGQIEGKPATEGMWVLASSIMLIPIVMILVSLMVPKGPLVWITVIAAALLVVFNLISMPYPGAFDNMLLIVSFAVNGITIWQALAWSANVAAVP